MNSLAQASKPVVHSLRAGRTASVAKRKRNVKAILNWRACLCLLCLISAGCQRSANPAPSGDAARADQAAHRGRPADRLAMDQASRSQPLQPGAAGAVELTLEAFRQGRLEMIFDALPGSYQQDVILLVRESSEQIDPQLWDMVVQVLQKSVDVLREQRSIFIALLTRPGAAGQAEITLAWDDFVDACDRLTRGSLMEREAWKDIDVREALRADVSRVTRRMMSLSTLANPPETNPLSALETVQVDLVESTGDMARVRILPRGSVDASPTLFVLVDGKWVPQSLTESWPATIQSVRAAMARWRTSSDVDLPAVKAQLRVIDQALDQMLLAKNVDQLAAAATPLVFQATRWSEPIALSPAVVPDGPPEGVSILINRELTEDELTRCLQLLEPLTDDPSLEYHLATANGGKTFITLKPVSDIHAFAAKLEFATDPMIDTNARVITLRDVRLQ